MKKYITVFSLVKEIIEVCRCNDISYVLPEKDIASLRKGFSRRPEIFFGVETEKHQDLYMALGKDIKENRALERIESQDGYVIKYADSTTTLIDLEEMKLTGANGFNVTIVPKEKVDDGTVVFSSKKYLISEDIPYKDIAIDKRILTSVPENSRQLKQAIDDNREVWQSEAKIVNNVFAEVAHILNGKEYLVSVVMAVYNTEDYLSEAIESVISQTINFKRIQLILVNDGSTDSSFEICRRYKEKYSENIILINQENKGVSAAKNAGLQYVSGKYTTFFDSDDVLPPNYFEVALRFFEIHQNEVDCVSTKIKIFGAKEYDHAMNFKYSSDRIVNTIEKPDHIITATGNVIYKTEKVREYRFDEEVGVGEDILFNTMFMMEREQYGLISSTKMHYRKREDDTSISGDNYHSKIWYQVLPQKVLMQVIEESIRIHGRVTKYVQNVVAFWCRYSIRNKGIWETLSDEEVAKFARTYKDLISVLDDEVIISMRKTSVFIKNHILEINHGEDILENATVDAKGCLRYKGNIVFDPKGTGIVSLESAKYSDGMLNICGRTKISRCYGRCKLYAEVSGNSNGLFPVNITETLDEQFTFDGAIADKLERFQFKVPVKNPVEIRMVAKYNDKDILYYPKPLLDLEECDFDSRISFMYKNNEITGLKLKV